MTYLNFNKATIDEIYQWHLTSINYKKMIDDIDINLDHSYKAQQKKLKKETTAIMNDILELSQTVFAWEQVYGFLKLESRKKKNLKDKPSDISKGLIIIERLLGARNKMLRDQFKPYWKYNEEAYFEKD